MRFVPFLLLPAFLAAACGEGPSGFPTIEIKGVKVLRFPESSPPAPVPLLMAYAETGTDMAGPPVNAMGPGELLRLQLATANNQDLTKEAKFESSDPSIVAVEDQRKLRGISPGRATVCGRHGDMEACQVFVVGHMLRHFRSSSEGGIWRSETVVTPEGRTVTTGTAGEARFSLEGNAANWHATADMTGTRVLDADTWELLDLASGKRIGAPKGPSTGDQDNIHSYAFAARGDETVFAYFPSTQQRVYLGVCSADDCPQVLEVVPECLPEGDDSKFAFGSSLAPDGSAAVAALWTEESGFALHAVAPETGACSLLWTGGPGSEKPITNLFPSVSPDARLVAMQALAGLVVVPMSQGDAEPILFPEIQANAQPVFSPDSRYVCTSANAGAGGAATLLDTVSGAAVSLPEGGAWTPWNTLHFATPTDAFEYLPETFEMLPSRVFHRLYDRLPGAPQAGMLRLDAPVGMPPLDKDHQHEEFQWLGPPDKAGAAMEDPAAPPGHFLAYLKSIQYLDTGQEGGYARVFVDVHDLAADRHSSILPGNQDVTSFDVAQTGVLFLATTPSGYLVMSDVKQRTWSALAVGVRGPVVAAQDASAVAATGPGSQILVWDTKDGAELYRSFEALSACPLPGAAGVLAAMPDGRILRVSATGEETLMASSGLMPEPNGQPVRTHWSWDCMTLLQLVPYGSAMLTRLSEHESYLIAGDIPGDKLHAGIARDGSAYAITCQTSEIGSEVSGLLTPTVDLVQVHVGTGPDWKPQKMVTAIEFANGDPNSGVSHTFLSPAIWPGGRRLAVPLLVGIVDVTHTDLGIHAVMADYVHLFLFDRDEETVTHLGQLDSPGDDIVRLR